MKAHQNDILLAVAKVIWQYEISIAEFYEHLGVDLENYRVDGEREVAQLAGIMTGWETKPDEK